MVNVKELSYDDLVACERELLERRWITYNNLNQPVVKVRR